MPVIRPRRPQWTAAESREYFVDQLTRELRDEAAKTSPGEDTRTRPVIFEIPINRDQSSIHVIVVWDWWEGVSPEDRTAIITEAYERFDESGNLNEPIAPRITVAIGATPADVNQLGLLPYRVEPVIMHGETKDIEKVWKAMWEEGAIAGTDRPILAFPTRQMADDAYDRLKEKLPEMGWYQREEREDHG
jgi:hypothetical protein